MKQQTVKMKHLFVLPRGTGGLLCHPPIVRMFDSIRFRNCRANDTAAVTAEIEIITTYDHPSETVNLRAVWRCFFKKYFQTRLKHRRIGCTGVAVKNTNGN